jgi:hypothetical protein
MKKMYNFVNMDYMTSTNNLMNYQLQGSNSNNYGSSPQTSSPDSFPVVMEEGILVRYEAVKFSTQIVEKDKATESDNHSK